MAAPAAMTAEQTAAALAFLRDAASASSASLADFERVGLVGEPTNALVAYLACVSRKLGKPLAVLIQSTSAAGKSTLMDTRARADAGRGPGALLGDDRADRCSTWARQDIKHRILAIAEEEGVRQAAYALKVLQSQGELTHRQHGQRPGDRHAGDAAIPGRRPGDAVPDHDRDRRRRGAGESVSGAHDQREPRADARDPGAAASAAHAGGLAGRRARREAIRQLHQNAQRLLRPLAVVNPYADQLDVPG